MPLRELRKHPYDYLVLVSGVILILAGFTLSWPDEYWQRIFILALGGFYSAWGIWHHSRERTLTSTTIVEYFIISIFVSTVLWMAISY